MEIFRAMARDQGPPVQLDRCGKCWRVWFDVPELERATGRRFLARLEGTPSPHPCPACQRAMINTLVGGEVTVEQCTHCKGALIDLESVKTLAGGPLVDHKLAPSPRRDADLGDALNDLFHSLFG
jgi:Zn-finger nucleic acid-binding protein